MNIIIIGPSGSGKGTQAELLGQKLNLPTLSVGQVLRDEHRAKTVLGEKAYHYWSRGELVPDQLTFAIVKSRLDQYDRGFILDGLPRRFDQIAFLEEYLRQKGQQIDKVIHLEIDDAEAIKRLLLRAKQDKDKTGKARDDETRSAIKNRLAFYHRQTQPILDYFDKEGKLLNINGQRSIEVIHNDILPRLS